MTKGKKTVGQTTQSLFQEGINKRKIKIIEELKEKIY